MSNEFINEVNQELHDERIVGLWKRFGRLIIGGCALIIVSTAGVTGYSSYTKGVAKSEALAFEQAIKTKNLDAISQLAVSGNAGSQLLSTMTLSQAYVAQGKFDQASNALLSYAHKTDEGIYKQYAVLASVWVRMQAGENKTLLPFVDSIISSGYYSVLARFTKVEILLSSNENKLAEQILVGLVVDPTLIPQQHEMARIALSTIQGQ